MKYLSMYFLCMGCAYVGVAVERWTRHWPDTGPWTPTILAACFIVAAAGAVLMEEERQ